NTNSAGAPDVPPFAYGVPGWAAVVGDWDADGRTSPGVFDPAGTWYLRNSTSAGAPDVAPFAYGAGGWKPLGRDADFTAAGPVTAGTGPVLALVPSSELVRRTIPFLLTGRQDPNPDRDEPIEPPGGLSGHALPGASRPSPGTENSTGRFPLAAAGSA